MLDINISLLVQIVNFLVIMFILNVILYRPITRIMEQRKQKVSGLEREIDGLLKNADQKWEDFKAKLNEASAQGNKEKEALRNAGFAEERQITSKTREEAEAQKAQMISQIERDAKKAEEELKGQISAFASEITAKILGRSI